MFPPKNGLPQLTPAEFKEIPCGGCGSPWRKRVSAFIMMQHRFNPKLTATQEVSWDFCRACGEQVHVANGALVKPGQEGAAPREILKEMESA